MTKFEIEKFIEGANAVFVRFKDILGAERIEICGRPYVVNLAGGIPEGDCLAGNRNFNIGIDRITGLQKVTVKEEWYEGDK